MDNLEFGLDKDALRSDRVSAKIKEKEKLTRIFSNMFDWRKEKGDTREPPFSGLRNDKPNEPSVVKPPLQERLAPYIKDNVTPEAKAEKEKKTPKWLQEKQEYEEEEE